MLGAVQPEEKGAGGPDWQTMPRQLPAAAVRLAATPDCDTATPIDSQTIKKNASSAAWIFNSLGSLRYFYFLQNGRWALCSSRIPGAAH